MCEACRCHRQLRCGPTDESSDREGGQEVRVSVLQLSTHSHPTVRTHTHIDTHVMAAVG